MSTSRRRSAWVLQAIVETLFIFWCMWTFCVVFWLLLGHPPSPDPNRIVLKILVVTIISGVILWIGRQKLDGIVSNQTHNDIEL